MTERHVLVSSRLGPVTGHAYLVRRNAKPAQARDDLNHLADVLSGNLEKMAKAEGIFWPPMLAATELDAESGGAIQELIYERVTSEGRQQLRKYRARKEPLFMAFWIMESVSTECCKLMDLH